MLYQEKLRLLKSMTLLSQMPERSLNALAEFLKPKEIADGAVVFEEGAWGMSLYFVSSGRIRIYKRAAGDSVKELAVVGPGDCFGEMAMIEEVPRSANAAAMSPCVLFEFFRGDLARWVKTSPQQAVQFFAQLSQVQSKRLRKTSRELTLHFDISNLLAHPRNLGPEFLGEVLSRVVSHLDGVWSAAAYLCSGTGGMMEQAVSHGSFLFDDFDASIGPEMSACGVWLDSATFHAALTSDGKTLGCVLFRAPTPAAPAERDDLALTLTTVCRSIERHSRS
jgi:CRP/FNR family cyclic AMP-dependent transcriptional regulator